MLALTPRSEYISDCHLKVVFTGFERMIFYMSFSIFLSRISSVTHLKYYIFRKVGQYVTIKYVHCSL